MSSKDYKKIAFYPNRKIFSQKFIRWNAELDERKKNFDIMGTLINDSITTTTLYNALHSTKLLTNDFKIQRQL